MTLTIAPAAWATSTTAAMSAWTSASRPDFRAPIWITMSSSVAPSASARRASATLISVVVVAVREPDDRADRHVRAVEDRPRRARRPPAGTHTDATSYSAASRQPASTNASSSSGRSREWSITLAMSRSVRESIEIDRHSVPHLTVRPQDVAGDEEALLDPLVGALEATVLVLDDAVALVARRGTARREDDAPVHLAEARDAAAPASRCPCERMPRSYRPSRSIIRSLAWTCRMCGPNSLRNRGDGRSSGAPGATGRSSARPCRPTARGSAATSGAWSRCCGRPATRRTRTASGSSRW